MSGPLPPLPALPPRRVSCDGRFLVNAKGDGFPYLADTAWEIFHRMDANDIVTYLDDRQAKGFTVIQAALLCELDGLRIPDRQGRIPLIGLDPDCPDENWLRWVEWVLDEGAARGLTFALVVAWGDKVKPLARGAGPIIFNPANGRRFTRMLSARWLGRPIIWIIGGDRNPETNDEFAIWDTMAEGLIEGGGADTLVTFHPEGYRSSAEFFHDRPWLAFNAMQSGHGRRDYPVHEGVLIDAARAPRKPIIDLEPCYEDVPIEFWKLTAGRRWIDIPEAELNYASYRKHRGYMDAWDVRKAIYRALFAGAAGAAYGHNAVWQVWKPGSIPRNVPSPISWLEALNRPGAQQMRHARTVLDRFGWLEPLPALITLEPGPFSPLVARSHRTGDLLVYLPAPHQGFIQRSLLDGAFGQHGVLLERINPTTGCTDKKYTQPADALIPWSTPEQVEDAILVLRPAIVLDIELSDGSADQTRST